ncbi:MAG: glycosyltransferase [Thermodesulfobacteriota bacterium]
MEQTQPFFSIIIPTYGRPNQLEVCLNSLSRLAYPIQRFEVIVVDDGSRTPPEAVVANFRDRVNITLLTQPNSGPASARNTGAAHAKGEFLAFTDDDCTSDSAWLKALADRFKSTPDHLIGGQTINALSENIFSTASQQLVSYLYDYYNLSYKRTRLFISNNLAVPAEQFRTIGGFDTSFPLAAGEDREFSDRWLHHGYRTIYAPEALVYHAHPLSLLSFCRQHFNYGRGALRFHELRAQRSQARVRPEPPTFYLNLLRYPFSQTQGWRALLASTLLTVSQAANAAGFLWESMNQLWRK